MENKFLKIDTNNDDMHLSNEILDTKFMFENNDLKYLGPIDKINIFVGANNSGKSRLLRGILKNQFQLFTNNKDVYTHLFSVINIEKRLTEIIITKNENFQFQFLIGSLDSKQQMKFSKLYAKVRNQQINGYKIDSPNIITINKDYFQIISTNLSQSWEKIMKEEDKTIINDLLSISILQLEIINSFKDIIQANIDVKIITLIISFYDLLNELLEIIKQIKISTPKIPKRIYIPVLRTASSLFNDENIKINSDIFKRTIYINYKFDLASEVNIEISTGLEFYSSIKKTRNDFRPVRIKFENFEKFLKKNFFNNNKVDIVARESDEHKEKNILIHIEGDDEERDIHNLGDGIQSIIMLMFPIFTAENGSWIFIEEPEINLHPGLQRLFLDHILNNEIIQKKDLTIFFSTHSNHLLDISLTNEKGISIFTFEKQKRKEEFIYNIRNVKSDDLDILSKLEVNNSSVFLANCSIWVEGVTDRKYIKAFLKLLYSTGTNRREFMEDINYAFFEYAGSNLKHYLFSSEETFESIKAQFLSNKIFLIADKDEHKEKKHAYLKKQLNKNFNYKVISVREIENILSPVILKKILQRCEIVDSEKLETKTMKISDYKNKPLGKYIDENFATTGKTFSAPSGTLSTYYKNKFADLVFNNEIDVSWNDLSPSAKDLTNDIYKFIRKSNQHL